MIFISTNTTYNLILKECTENHFTYRRHSAVILMLSITILNMFSDVLVVIELTVRLQFIWIFSLFSIFILTIWAKKAFSIENHKARDSYKNHLRSP